MSREKIAIFLMITQLTLPLARATEPERIFVSSSVKDFNLAEEASYLLQCVAANSGKETEFAQNTKAVPRIVLSEFQAKLKIEAFGPQESWRQIVPQEEILAQCPKVELILASSQIPAPPPLTAAAAIPEIHAEPEQDSWLTRNRTMVYITGGLALAAGSYFLIRSRHQTPTYRSVRPELP